MATLAPLKSTAPFSFPGSPRCQRFAHVSHSDITRDRTLLTPSNRSKSLHDVKAPIRDGSLPASSGLRTSVELWPERRAVGE